MAGVSPVWAQLSVFPTVSWESLEERREEEVGVGGVSCLPVGSAVCVHAACCHVWEGQEGRWGHRWEEEARQAGGCPVCACLPLPLPFSLPQPPCHAFLLRLDEPECRLEREGLFFLATVKSHLLHGKP